jgi:hypothetical protein
MAIWKRKAMQGERSDWARIECAARHVATAHHLALDIYPVEGWLGDLAISDEFAVVVEPRFGGMKLEPGDGMTRLVNTDPQRHRPIGGEFALRRVRQGNSCQSRPSRVAPPAACG